MYKNKKFCLPQQQLRFFFIFQINLTKTILKKWADTAMAPSPATLA